MSYLILGIELGGLGLLAWGLYMVYSPTYNTTEDYAALIPLICGLAFMLLGLVIWGVRAVWQHFF